MPVTLERADITCVEMDAIVNAANERMLGGGGVDGAIHRAAGPELLEACRQLPELRPGVRCPTGEARITPGFQLSSTYVIHTVGPIYQSESHSAPLLASCYQSCLELALQQGLRRVAFPAISCGIYGYPLEPAARISLSICLSVRDEFEELRFVLYSPKAFEAWTSVYQQLA